MISARRRTSRSARGSPAWTAARKAARSGCSVIPSAAAASNSVVSEAATARQPVRPQWQSRSLSGTGRWATSPVGEAGPTCTVPATARAASTTWPTNRCTIERRAAGCPNRISAWVSARAWLSTWTGSPEASESSAASGRSRHRNGS